MFNTTVIFDNKQKSAAKLAIILTAGLLTGFTGYAQQNDQDSLKNKTAPVTAKENFKDDWSQGAGQFGLFMHTKANT